MMVEMKVASMVASLVEVRAGLMVDLKVDEMAEQ